MTNRILIALFSATLVFILSSCSDSGTGSDPGDPPPVPTIEHVHMDLSIFDINGTQGQQLTSEDVHSAKSLFSNLGRGARSVEVDAYEEAAWHAWMVNQLFVSFSVFPSIYFNADFWGEPDYSDNTWIWDFSYSYGSESASLVIAAEEIGNAWLWELRISISSAEYSVDNALFLSANISSDGSEGSWRFHDPETGGNDYMEMEFRVEGEITTYVGFRVSEDSAGFDYESDGIISSIFYWEGEGSQAYTAYIEWNNDTGTGWIESTDYNDGQRVCWDSSFQSVSC